MDQAHTTIGATQKYALDELDAIAKNLESTKVGDLATKAKEAEPKVQKWRGVLARCFQLQEAVDVLELDKRMAQSPEKFDAYLRGMKFDRQKPEDSFQNAPRICWPAWIWLLTGQTRRWSGPGPGPWL